MSSSAKASSESAVSESAVSESLSSESFSSEKRGIALFESLHHLEGRKFTPLESAKQLFAALGDPQNAIPSVHVAGTNGKGTVCAILAAIFSSQGFSVGQTSSPHLVSVTERCIVDGTPVDEDAFGAAVEEVVSAAEREGLSPSYFVLGLVAAFSEFRRRGLDRVVVEVGLGGRFDATNILARPLASVVTSISADHTDVLGGSLSQIAWHKAGIAKDRVPLFVGNIPPEARDVILEEARLAGAPCELLGRDFFYDADADELTFGGERHPAYLRELALAGRHQLENAALAARIAYALGATPAEIRSGMLRVRWPGRLELVERALLGDAPVLLDVAHNPAGIAALVEHVGTLVPSRFERVAFLVSILDRKDWRRMLEIIQRAPFAGRARIVLTDSGTEGAVRPESLSDAAPGALVEASPERALSELTKSSGPGTLIVITGSAFLVGRLRPLVTDAPVRTIAG